MLEHQIDQYNLLRFIIFFSYLILFLLLEQVMPRYRQRIPRSERGFTNIILGLINTLVLRVLSPISLFVVAEWAQAKGIGLFNFVKVNQSLVVLFGIITLDLMIYWQHRWFHQVPLLWKLHRVHHTDRELDTTSAIRFHPLEIVLSLFYKHAIIIIFGLSPITLILFEIILSTMSLFNHANLYIPQSIENKLRLVFITPDMHRIHHQENSQEMNSNFGFSTSLWDYLFKSRTLPKFHRTYSFGVVGYEKDLNLFNLITSPFTR